MSVYLCANFEVSSIILTGLRQGDNFTPPPSPPQNEHLKSPPRLGFIEYNKINLSLENMTGRLVSNYYFF